MSSHTPDDSECFIKSFLDYFIQARTDNAGNNRDHLNFIKEHDREINKTILHSDIFPDKLLFHTPYLTLLLEKQKQKIIKEKYKVLKKVVKESLEIEIKSFDEFCKATLTAILLCGPVETYASHRKWSNLKLSSKHIYNAIKFLDLLSNTGRYALMNAVFIGEGINIEDLKEDPKKRYGFACTLGDLLATGGVINARAAEGFGQKDWRGGDFKGAPLRPTIITPLVSKIIEMIGKHNLSYVYGISSEMFEILSLIKKKLESRIKETPIGKLTNETIKLLNENARFKQLSYYFDYKFYQKIHEEFVELALLYHWHQLWEVDLHLLLGHSTIKLRRL